MGRTLKKAHGKIDRFFTWVLAEEKEDEVKLKRRLHIHLFILCAGSGLLVLGGFSVMSTNFALILGWFGNGLQEYVDYKGRW